MLPIRGIIPLELGSYKVFDVNDYSDEELIKRPGILTKILSLEKAKNSIQVEEKTNIITECNLNEREKAYLNQYITYIIGEAYGEKETNKLLEKINKNVREEKSMLIDVLYQVEARGEEKGKKKIRDIVINMLKNNYSDKEIKKISEITDSELKEIKKQLNNV